MKLITVEQARLLDLYPLEELRPDYGIYLPEFVRAVSERYGFVAVPTDLKDAAENGAKFEHGHAMIDGQSVVIKNLGVYNDGIIVDTYHSKMSDAVLADLMQWATEKFSLHPKNSPDRRTYTSMVVVEFEGAVEPALGALGKIGDMMSDYLRTFYGWEHAYNLTRLGLAVDPKKIPHLRNTGFLLERRVGIEYATNRWACGAPLPTETHLELLGKIEQLLPI
jgi:hypothetical protein